MSHQFEQYWTIQQVAQRLHAGVSTVEKWLGSGRLEKRKAGGKTLISETAVQDFLRRCTEQDEAVRRAS